VVRSMISAWKAGLLNTRMYGAPGIPLGAMAQVRPYFLRVPQCAGSISSTDGQPRSRATRQVRSASHFSPRALKHQNTTDCLTRPLRVTFGSSAAEASGGRKPPEVTADEVTAAAAATAPRRRWRRFMGRLREEGSGGEYTYPRPGRRQVGSGALVGPPGRLYKVWVVAPQFRDSSTVEQPAVNRRVEGSNPSRGAPSPGRRV